MAAAGLWVAPASRIPPPPKLPTAALAHEPGFEQAKAARRAKSAARACFAVGRWSHHLTHAAWV
ncbi:hypothetical protein OHB06_48745 [Streptomyces sp. NBC_01604]|uniref:hypothetical protein n=1 Tax=Streptomyces sp. NBC_01604 TaxID=2975894 RepID=UPI00386DBBFF